jgi:AcrR family transcriptional regulator
MPIGVEMPKKKAIGVRAQRKAARPIEILDAAFEEFVAHGYVATRVEDIAARVGVTKGTVYFYFETKEVLFEEMFKHMSAPMADIRAQLKTLSGPYPDRIKAFFHFFYERIVLDRKSREMLRFILSEGSRFPHVVDRHYDEAIAPMFDAARELYEQGVAAGELRASAALQIPELTLSPAILLSFWYMLFADRKPRDVKAFIDGHIDLILNGMAIRADDSKTG